MKPIFADAAGRRSWYRLWRQTYADMSQDIRRKRRELHIAQRQDPEGAGTRRLQKMLHYSRRVAHKMMGLREDADRRWQRIRKMQNDLAEQNAQFPLDLGECKRIDFSFNKIALEYPFMPNWLLKTKGRSYYVSDVQSQIGFSTRNRPDGNTRGMLRFDRGDIVIDAEGVAHISQKAA